MPVTSRSGSISLALLQRLLFHGFKVRASNGTRLLSELKGVQHTLNHDMTASTDLSAALGRAESIVHGATRVHVMQDDTKGTLQAHREVILTSRLNLACRVAVIGVTEPSRVLRIG